VEPRTVKKPTAFGKYFLLERINVGGMAEVFRAKAFGVEGFERLVAVKRILPNIAEDKEFIRMFIEEAKLSVQLNHANIAQIFDLGVVEGSYYIALEHVHGRDLRGIFDRCRQLGEAMPVAQACFMVMKLCEGLDYAHNKRDQSGRELALVHRDVSPQNVLVSFEGEVKIIDFGIAKAAGKGS
jgi:serine/threonine protein kinase